MSKVKIVRDMQDRFYGIRFDCPGCASKGHVGHHVLPVNWRPAGETEESPHVAGKDHWDFNGDFERPVLSPSILRSQDTHVPPVTPDNLDEWKRNPWPQTVERYVCHSFIGINGAQPGQIKFLGDCTHALANQTVDLPEQGKR